MVWENTAQELLARVARYDERALGVLYDRFAPGLLAILRRILVERQEAEEVLQEVFLRLCNQASHFSREGIGASAWLALVARSAAVDRLRAEKGLAPQAGGSHRALWNNSSWLPRAEQIALLERRSELLKKVIKQLPSHQRQALDLAVFDGYTEAEIAQKLGQPLGKVRTELRAAMSFLRHRLRAVMGTWVANI
jgi:RNA polymerase sigma-70 factor (ECF subfamily)